MGGVAHSLAVYGRHGVLGLCVHELTSGYPQWVSEDLLSDLTAMPIHELQPQLPGILMYWTTVIGQFARDADPANSCARKGAMDVIIGSHPVHML